MRIETKMHVNLSPINDRVETAYRVSFNVFFLRTEA